MNNIFGIGQMAKGKKETYINQTSTVVWNKLESEVIYITMNGSGVGSCSGKTITSSVLMENMQKSQFKI